jgi:divalent metal cation (Fe/Co/Zn/Cd) transporter
LLRPHWVEVTVFVLILGGAVVKSLGFVLTLSRTLFVDALTCVASVVAAYFFMLSSIKARKPPDIDHPYGHGRFLIWSALLTLIVYSFVAGIAVAGLIFWGFSEDLIDPLAAYTAAAGMGLYSGAVYLARGVEHAGSSLAYFSSSEILESAVTLVAVALGSTISPLYDFGGGIVLTSFLFYGLVREARELAPYIVDYAPPDLLKEIENTAKELDLEISDVKVRAFLKGRYRGEVVVKVPEGISLEKAHEIADKLVKELEQKGICVSVHYEPSNKEHHKRRKS